MRNKKKPEHATKSAARGGKSISSMPRIEAYFPEYWQEHERRWTQPQRTTLRSLLLHDYAYDDDGIIYIKRRILEGHGRIYSPIRIIQHALRYYNEFLSTAEEHNKRKFLLYCEWLVTHITTTPRTAAWVHTEKMNLSGYSFTKPWISAMDLGMGLSVFIRYHQFLAPREQRKLRAIMKKMVAAFGLRVSEGGVRDTSNGTWYEEFAAAKRAHVLNGFVYALFGLHEYAAAFHDTEAQHYFDEGINTLTEQLYLFDVRLGPIRWTRYDTGRIFYSGIHYHTQVHVPQMKLLHAITGKKIFLHYYHRWSEYAQTYGPYIRIIDLPLLGIIKLRGLLGI